MAYLDERGLRTLKSRIDLIYLPRPPMDDNVENDAILYLRSTKDGDLSWSTKSAPTQTQISTAVNEWLSDPEHAGSLVAVIDGSIGYEKLNAALKDIIAPAAKAYNPNGTYEKGSYAVYQGETYKYMSDQWVQGSWDPSKWEKITVGDSLTAIEQQMKMDIDGLNSHSVAFVAKDGNYLKLYNYDFQQIGDPVGPIVDETFGVTSVNGVSGVVTIDATTLTVSESDDTTIKDYIDAHTPVTATDAEIDALFASGNS